jgi:hypothetical protein
MSAKEIFKIGDRIKMKDSELWDESYRGEVGTVTNCFENICGDLISIKWDNPILKGHDFCIERFEFAKENCCPRCNGRLEVKTISASLFSDETITIFKCTVCGWC